MIQLTDLRNEIKEYFKNKVILVTGGAGSIGRALIKKLLEIGVKKVRAFDINESNLAFMQRIFPEDSFEVILGDIRDKECLRDAVRGVNIVFHAAALKHVPLSEYYPLEYVRTNILGTQNIIEVSQKEHVEKFILISTDKAVNPINVMGATKLLAERITIAANLKRTKERSAFSCVRFGNVLYTRGSVLEIFLHQIKNKHITVTDPTMTRFIMSIGDAVNFILKATYLAKGGEIFIPKMKSVRIIDLAKAFVELFAPMFNLSPGEVEIRIIGRRPGEKIHEELMTEFEASRAVELDDMFIVYPEISQRRLLGKKLAFLERYTSETAPRIELSEIKETLKDFFKLYKELHEYFIVPEIF